MDLNKLERIGKAATAAPWSDKPTTCSVGCCDDIHELVAQYSEDESPCRNLGTLNGGNAVWLKEGETEANAAFVIAARNNWQAMIDWIRQLEAERAEWMAVRWPLEDWMQGRITTEQLLVTVAPLIEKCGKQVT